MTSEFTFLPAGAELLADSELLESTIKKLAKAINEDFWGKSPLFLCVMNGALVFAGKLLTHINQCSLTVDYAHVSRYGDGTEPGDLSFYARPQAYSMQDTDVLIIDDILDKGVTLKFLQEHCESRGARSVKTVALVKRKRPEREVVHQADYVGLELPNKFVFGYGMDYQGFYRNLPGIYTLAD